MKTNILDLTPRHLAWNFLSQTDINYKIIIYLYLAYKWDWVTLDVVRKMIFILKKITKAVKDSLPAMIYLPEGFAACLV